MPTYDAEKCKRLASLARLGRADEVRFDLADQLLAATQEVERLRAIAGTFDKRCADRLAEEVAVLVLRKVIDSRSPAADALLDYRDPPSTEHADRLAKADAECERLRKLVGEACDYAEGSGDKRRPYGLTQADEDRLAAIRHDARVEGKGE